MPGKKCFGWKYPGSGKSESGRLAKQHFFSTDIMWVSNHLWCHDNIIADNLDPGGACHLPSPVLETLLLQSVYRQKALVSWSLDLVWKFTSSYKACCMIVSSETLPIPTASIITLVWRLLCLPAVLYKALYWPKTLYVGTYIHRIETGKPLHGIVSYLATRCHPTMGECTRTWYYLDLLSKLQYPPLETGGIPHTL